MWTVTGSHLPIPADYADWLRELKQRIREARHRALLAVNGEQIRLYHHIGREILERQSRQGWGAKVIDRLSTDLRAAFPEARGFSTRNLKYMRHFAQECPELQIGQQPAAQLPWFHIVILLTQVPMSVSGGGTPGRQSRRAGPAISSSCTSDNGSTCDRARP